MSERLRRDEIPEREGSLQRPAAGGEGCRSASGATKSRRERASRTPAAGGQGCGPPAQIPEREGQTMLNSFLREEILNERLRSYQTGRENGRKQIDAIYQIGNCKNYHRALKVFCISILVAKTSFSLSVASYQQVKSYN